MNINFFSFLSLENVFSKKKLCNQNYFYILSIKNNALLTFVQNLHGVRNPEMVYPCNASIREDFILRMINSKLLVLVSQCAEYNMANIFRVSYISALYYKKNKKEI